MNEIALEELMQVLKDGYFEDMFASEELEEILTQIRSTVKEKWI